MGNDIKINKGLPEKFGMYVVYVFLIKSIIERKLLMFCNDVWFYPSSDQKYRGEILGWIGPLPIL